MQRLSKKNHCRNIPHFKTHKSLYITRKQLNEGADGITCAKLSEAQLLVEAGINNIILAYPVIGKKNFQRFLNLYEYSRIIPVFDSYHSLKTFDDYLKSRTIDQIEFYLEIDTGLHRLGIHPDYALKIVNKFVKDLKVLKISGLLSHAGHSYSAKDPDSIRKIANDELEIMKKIKEEIRKRLSLGLDISIGSTPTLRSGVSFEAADNIRPGNYVYNDAIGIALGYAKPDECGLRVLSRVISKHGKRVVIDAGSKALGLDKGAHSSSLLDSYGLVLKNPGSADIVKKAKIERLSEEHGIIINGSEKQFKPGNIIEIIPNHSCFVANLFDYMYLVDEDLDIIQKLKIEGRGLST